MLSEKATEKAQQALVLDSCIRFYAESNSGSGSESGSQADTISPAKSTRALPSLEHMHAYFWIACMPQLHDGGNAAHAQACAFRPLEAIALRAKGGALEPRAALQNIIWLTAIGKWSEIQCREHTVAHHDDRAGSEGAGHELDDARAVKYVALGESYAAGQGLPPYSDVPAAQALLDESKSCMQSEQAWPRQLAEALEQDHDGDVDLTFLACAGARISHGPNQVRSPRHRPVIVQAQALVLQLHGAFAACMCKQCVACNTAPRLALAVLTPPCLHVTPSQLQHARCSKSLSTRLAKAALRPCTCVP